MISWRIARSEWVPTLKMESESHGGLPHLQSVERWMDRVSEACRPIWERHAETPFGFNAVEIYLALAAALFHDIGRGRPGKEEHGEISRQIINSHWAQLGIRDGRIAHELGLICAFHTEDRTWQHHDVTTIHPWGVVHTEAIASFLTLVDELDTAYTRAAPQYMKAPELVLSDRKTLPLDLLERMDEDYFTKGLYREFISDVELDPSSHLIKTILFTNRLPGPLDAQDSEEHRLATNWLDKLHKSRDCTPQFTIDDYFFSYLTHLRPHVSGLMFDFIANQYQKAVNFNRVGLIRDLHLPASYPSPGNLVYNLHLWDRQLTIGPKSHSQDDSKAIAALQETIKLITDTFKDVERRIKAAEQKSYRLSSSKKELVHGILLRVEAFLHYLHFRTCKLKEEQREGRKQVEKHLEDSAMAWRNVLAASTLPDALEHLGELREDKSVESNSRKGLLRLFANLIPVIPKENTGKPPGNGEGDAKGDTHKDTEPQTSTYPEDKTFSATDAHHVVQLLFHALTFVDIEAMLRDGSAVENLLKPSKPLAHERFFRPRKSWTVEAFHTNLLLAFHVYLINVRALWCDKLDFRYEGAGKAEMLVPNLAQSNDLDRTERHQQILETFSKLFEPDRQDQDPQDQDPQDQDGQDQDKPGLKEPATLFNADMETFVRRRKKRRDEQGMATGDFEFAVRFMFMQWLAGDLRGKVKTLERIKAGLQKIEIPFTDWFAEYNNHLFDSAWRLRIEPVLNPEMMRHLTENVYRLSKELHSDHLQTPWRTLAAELRDPKLRRVKAGATRLASLMRVFGDLPENTAPGKDLHFGHVLLSELCREERLRDSAKPGPVSLQTSFSGWKLDWPKNAEDGRDAIRRHLHGICVPPPEREKSS